MPGTRVLVLPAGLLAVSLLTAVAAPAAPAGPSASRPVDAARTLHFPPASSIGTVWIRSSDYAGSEDEFHHFADNADWHRVGQARGEVIIPPGQHVRLDLSGASGTQLAKLGPDDVQHVLLLRGGEAALPAISRLTGLKTLEFPRWFEPSPTPWKFSPKSLRLLARLPALERVQLPEGITDDGIAVLVEACPQLKKVYFMDDNEVSDAGLATLAKLRGLEALSIGGGRMTAAGLAPLAQLPSLRSLELWGSFDDAVMPHVRGIESLEILGLSYQDISDAGVKQLAGHPRLRVLSLYNTDVTVDGFDALAELPALRKLNLGKWGGRLERAEQGMPKLAALRHLEHLELPEGLSDAGVAWMGNMGSLRHLRIGSSDRAPLTDRALEQLARLQSLEHLFIGGLGFTDRGIASLSGLTRMKSLRLFAAPGMTNAGLADLSSMKDLETLCISSVARTRITTSGLTAVNAFVRLEVLEVHAARDDGAADFSGLHNLRRATISGQLRDPEIATLRDLPRLEQLSLGHCPEASDAALAHIARQLGSLQSLSIQTDRCTDRGVAAVARLPGLWSLRLTGDFTDRALASVESMGNVQVLDLTPRTPFSPPALDHLRKAAPQVTLRQPAPKKSRGRPAG